MAEVFCQGVVSFVFLPSKHNPFDSPESGNNYWRKCQVFFDYLFPYLRLYQMGDFYFLVFLAMHHYILIDYQ